MPSMMEKVSVRREQAVAPIDAQADEVKKIPEETIDAVNAIARIPEERLETMKGESGFRDAFHTFSKHLDTIKRRARGTIEKLLIATTLIGPAVPLQSCTTDVKQKTLLR